MTTTFVSITINRPMSFLQEPCFSCLRIFNCPSFGYLFDKTSNDVLLDGEQMTERQLQISSSEAKSHEVYLASSTGIFGNESVPSLQTSKISESKCNMV